MGNPAYPSHRLTDRELVSIISVYFAPTTEPKFPGVPSRGTEGAAEVAYAIVRAESDGVINAERPESRNPLGGRDRGIWQWNSKAWPDITDAQAFDPLAATDLARERSNGGADWGPWNLGPNAYTGRPRTDLDLGAARAAFAAHYRERYSLDEIRSRMTALGVDPETGRARIETDNNFGPLGSIFGGLQDLIGLAWKALKLLTSGAFWRRAGIVIGGLVLLALGLVALFGKDAARGYLAARGAGS